MHIMPPKAIDVIVRQFQHERVFDVDPFLYPPLNVETRLPLGSSLRSIFSSEVIFLPLPRPEVQANTQILR
jgi:hypothetical protein